MTPEEIQAARKLVLSIRASSPNETMGTPVALLERIITAADTIEALIVEVERLITENANLRRDLEITCRRLERDDQ